MPTPNQYPYVPHFHGEAVQEKYRSHFGWLTAAVHSSVPWPQEDVLVHYDGDDYFLRGVNDHSGRMSAPAITMRCAKEQIDEVLGKVYRFASILGWFKQGCVYVGSHVTGSHPILYSEPAQTGTILAGGRNGFDCNYMPIIRDDSTRRALTFWREGLHLKQFHIGYAFLSFFKVIESQLESNTRIRWMNGAIPQLTGEAGKRVQVLLSDDEDVGSYIYKSGRSAIAHAQFSDGRGDPDIPSDRVRLAKDIDIVEALARKYISEVLQVPDESDVHSIRNRLLPLRTVVSTENWNLLCNGHHVSRRRVGIHGLRVGVALWPKQPTPVLSNLSIRVTEVRNGHVSILAGNDSTTLQLAFILDFREGKAHVDLEASRYTPPIQGSLVDAAVSTIEFRKAVLFNGIVELWLPDGGRVDCEMVLPMNIDVSGTAKNMDSEIEALHNMSDVRLPLVPNLKSDV